MLHNSESPTVALRDFDHLWFQVSGTLCNFTCAHCFISCSPHNRTFGMLSLQEVQHWLAEAVTWGVKEYYFTGGEPFLNPELVPMLEATLRQGPATVLTNGSVWRDDWLKSLTKIAHESIYSLEFRVSLDGFSAEMNDPIRGEGTFDRTLRGIVRLADAGFLPLITAARTWPLEQEAAVVGAFLGMLKRAGYSRPRLKILPTLKLGAEIDRTSDYAPDERVTAEMLSGFDLRHLICSHSRIVTDRGVHVCPLLIEAPESLLGSTLAESRQEFALTHGACWTCYQFGAICSNPSSGLRR